MVVFGLLLIAHVWGQAGVGTAIIYRVTNSDNLRRRCPWGELIQQVWGADPLQCPLCAGQLQPIGVVKTKADIYAVLAPT